MSETHSDSKVVQEAASSGSTQDARASSLGAKDTIATRVINALPDEPYLLSTPSSRAYNMRPEFADNWRIDGLFERNEEHLQYQTFFYRDTLNSLFSLHDRHVEESRRRGEALRAAGGLKSGPGTPAHLQTAKKKISLSDYTNKTKHSQSTTPAAQPLPEDSKFGDASSTLVKQPIPSSLSTTVQPIHGIASPQDKSTALTEPTSVAGSESRKIDVMNEEAADAMAAPKAVANGISSASMVSPAVTTVATQTSTETLLEAPSRTQTHKRTIDNITEDIPSADKLTDEFAQPKPAKKPRLETIQEQQSVPAISVQNSQAGLSLHNNDPKETSKEIFTGAQVESSLKTATAQATGNDLTKFINGLSEAQIDKKLPAAPIAKLYDESNIRTPNFQYWFPGMQSPNGDESLPQDLPDIPAWDDLAISMLGNRGKVPSHSPSTSDSLKISAAYSQTSDSSVASSLVDPAPSRAEVVSQAAPTQPSNSDRPKKKPENKSLGEGQARLPSVSGKRIPQHASVSDKAPPIPQKVARKTVQATPARGPFFENPKKKPTSASPLLAPQAPIASDTPKLVVKLKYGKSLAKNVQRILQLKPSNKRDTTVTTKISAPPVNSTSTHEIVRQESRPGAKKNEKKDEKKRAQDDTTATSERPFKRRKPDNQDINKSPRTPSMPAIHSPVSLTPISTSLHRKLLTPKTDVKHGKVGVPVPKASTPQSTFATPNTSMAADPPSGALSQAGSERMQIWRREYEKQNELAKNLKRKYQALARTKEGDGAEDLSAEMKKAALEGVESVLSFMQTFVAFGESNRNSRNLVGVWDSIQPFAKEVSRSCHRFEHIHGMSMLLRSLCFSVFGALCAKTSTEDLICLGKTDSEILKKVMGNLKEMQQLEFQAERLLSRTTLAVEYPLTYAEYEKITLGLLLKPMVAVRMGCRFLGEWATKHKVEWKMQLEEGLCSQL